MSHFLSMVLGGALCWKIMNLTLTVYLCDWGLKLSVSQNFRWWEVGGGMNSQKSFRKKQHFSRKAMDFLAWSSQSHCNLCGTMAM